MGVLQAATTGLKGLDEIVQNLRLGDNVVWQVDDLASYRHFVDPYVKQAIADGKNLVYIRFANHEPLLKDNKNVKIYKLDAAEGFETFTKQLHAIIAKEGRGAFYVFDCLSDLLSAWATDLMIGNFFRVTCPYLFRLDTIAYFALYRNNHSFKTVARIRETTQLLMDVYEFENDIYVHPLKVWNRHSPTMFLPHQEKAGEFVPIINSVDVTRLFSYLATKGTESAQRNLDYWDRLFFSAAELAQEDGKHKEKTKMLQTLSRLIIGRELRMLGLADQHFSLEDMLAIKERMIGTGFIGGKAVGMLLARKILLNDESYYWGEHLEPHDSFFVGSDVFYSYIVENGWWELWLEQKSEKGYFEKAKILREKMLHGKFPHEVKEKFHQLIEYFGQSPIIMRSSSLLEDSFGNAFAGKYESVFIVNQGSPEERYKQFEETVRQVFASAMSEDALTYRQQRGLSQQDEQMALLVQRVSGTQRKHNFFPFVAGVGVSYNTFVWHEDMDPKAGMLRVVFGLGTRAVNRVEGDYPAIIALDAPMLRPYAGMDKAKRFSQHEVDVLNIDENLLQTVPLTKLLQIEPDIDLSPIGKRDLEAEKKLKKIGAGGQSWVLTFDGLLAKTNFSQNMQRILKTLEKSYQYPVDIEFTANFAADGKLQINLLQCRPLQTQGSTKRIKVPDHLPTEKLVLESQGGFMGGSVLQPLCRLIYVDPQGYGNLLMSEKYDLARLIGRINKAIDKEKTPTIMIGPGRWGTRDPSLGVPVNFAEINNIAVLVELDDPARGFMPELSFGSHFFLDLVETNIFYIALFLDKDNVFLHRAWLEGLPNGLEKLFPEAKRLAKVLKIYDFSDDNLRLISDITSQRVVCVK